jgi:hypothetical protein
MNAIILLERDHAKVKGLMARLDATTAQARVTRRRLPDRIRAELTVHETIEEVFVRTWRLAAGNQ